MTSYVERAREVLEQARALEEGASRVALVEECVRLADLSGDRDLRLETREELVAAGTFAGRMERSMTAFAWTLANYNEEEWGKTEIWLGFHWVSEDAPVVSTIGRVQIERLIDQMEDVFQRNQWWMYPVYMARFRAGVVFGEPVETLRPWLEAFERDYERREKQTAHYEHVKLVARARLGDLGGALDRLVVALDAGEHDEAPEYPHRSHSFAALALLLDGRTELARAHFSRAVNLCTQNQVFLREVARLLVFAEIDGRDEDIATLVERHLVWALDTWDHWSAMVWYIAAAHALRRLEGRELFVRLSAPEPRFGDGDPIAALRLAEAFRSEAVSLADAFDLRNGNTRWRSLADEIHDGGRPAALFCA